MNLNEKRIAVVGIGGVGGYIAGMLTRTFPKVTLCARGGRGESIRTNGLVLDSEYKGKSVTHPYAVVESADLLGEQDIIFVCVKNYSLEEVANLLNKVVTEDTIIVPIMNGVDPGDNLRSYLKCGTVVDSLIYIVAYANPDYSVKHENQFADVKIGIMNATEEEWKKVEEVSEVLAAADIDHEAFRDIEAEIWKKYILNAAYNVVTGAYNRNLGEVRDDPETDQYLTDLVNEAYMVALKKGVNVQQENIDYIHHRLHHILSGNGTSSLQRDVAAGRRAELETFGGYLVKEAERLGVDIPVSKKMYERLKAMTTR